MRLEEELVALGRDLRVAPPPDLEQRVLDRLDDADPGRGDGPRRALAVAAAALVVLLLVPPVRAVAVDSVGDLLRLAGIEVRWGEPSAPARPDTAPRGSRTTTLAGAGREAGFDVRLPRALGEPTRVRVVDGGRVVSTSWPGLTLDQVAADLSLSFVKTARSPVRQIEVAGVQYWWLEEPHDLVYVGRDGVERTATARRAGPTLAWSVDGRTYRLEGEELTLAEALRLARSVG